MQGVESFANLTMKGHLNQNGKTDSELLTESHKNLVKEWERWMKETATSYTVVGALIITTMFTAAFIVPRGINDSSLPTFLKRKSFDIFVIFDAISLFSSTTSVLMFLGVLTCRYAENDFLESLPRKLIIGLFALLVSIVAMMVAFCAAMVILVDGQLKLVIPIVLLASVPVIIFMSLQFPLLGGHYHSHSWTGDL